MKKIFLMGLFFSFNANLIAAITPIVPFFNDSKLINLEISGDYKEIKKGKDDYPEERAWNDISILIKDRLVLGSGKNILALTQVRGSNRLENCDFPPLKIDFKKETDLSKTIFLNAKKMKLVTQCNQDERARWVYREYLIYKIYEILGPLSFKTKPANIVYRQRKANDLTNLNGEIINSHFAFFLENGKNVGLRNGNLEKLDVNKFDRNLVDKFELTKIYLFHYLVGEHDIEIDDSDVRNVELYQNKINKNVFPVPYDFDYSMLVRQVDIDYMSYIRQICGFDHKLYQVRPLFIKNKVKIFSLVKDFPYLNTEEKERIKNSFLEFYKRIEDEAKFKAIVENSEKCHED